MIEYIISWVKRLKVVYNAPSEIEKNIRIECYFSIEKEKRRRKKCVW